MLHEEERLPLWYEVREHDATEGTCPLCKARVLIVFAAGEPIPVEPEEIVPGVPCPRCEDIERRGKRKRRVCEACLDTGWLGGPGAPPYAVAVFEDGSAREWRQGEKLRRGEALHEPHVCDGEWSGSRSTATRGIPR